METTVNESFILLHELGNVCLSIQSTLGRQVSTTHWWETSWTIVMSGQTSFPLYFIFMETQSHFLAKTGLEYRILLAKSSMNKLLAL